MTIVEEKKRKVDTFAYRGGYIDRITGLEPQEWDNVDYRAGYAEAICELVGLEDYQPVHYG